MGESASAVVLQLRELQSLASGVHWFCPRHYDGDPATYADDDALQVVSGAEDQKPDLERIKQTQEAKRRTDIAISCLRILTIETEDMAASIEWYRKQLDQQMVRCDVCVRTYHQKKRKYIETLTEDHDEDDVAIFAKIVGDSDLTRIKSGLIAATQALQAAEPQSRGLAVLEGLSLFAIFEAFSSEAVLKNPQFMEEYLDEPFHLVQTRRPLRLNDYVPAMGQFLFDETSARRSWADRSWRKIGHGPTKEEFWWVVQDPLFKAMQRAASHGQDSGFLEIFWRGVYLIVDKLDKDLITHCLRALEIDIYRLALDHIQLDSHFFRSVLQTLKALLVKSPNDFWEAMGAISPSCVVESICNSPQFGKVLQEAESDQPQDGSSLQDMLSWIEPFMSSLKAANQPPACRALVTQFMERFQVGIYTTHARMCCFLSGLGVLASTLRSFVDSKTTIDGSVGRVVVSEIMEVVSRHIDHILAVAHLPEDEPLAREFASVGMNVVRNALALDCQCFKIDHDALMTRLPLQEGNNGHSQTVWKAVAKALHPNRVSLAKNTLVGMIGQVGLEKFKTEGEGGQVKDKIKFNERYSELLQSITDIFGQLSNFNPEALAILFQKIDTASALLAGLIAADQSVYEAAIEVIKIVSGQSGRREALSYLLRSYFETTVSCITWTIRRIAHRQIFASNPRMLKTCGDVIEVLCNDQDGVLNGNSFTDREKFVIRGFWQYIWSALTVIFKTTEAWGTTHDSSLMKEFCRDTMQFAENLFNQYNSFANAIDPKISAVKVEEVTSHSTIDSGRQLLEQPTTTIDTMVKWLRLRDEYLAGTLEKLVCQILRRLREWGITVSDKTLAYIEDVAIRNAVKTVLSPQQKAELARALDEHLDRLSPGAESISAQPATAAKQSTLSAWTKSINGVQTSQSLTTAPKKNVEVIDLESWRSKAKVPRQSIETASGKGDIHAREDQEDEILSASRSVEKFKAQQAEQNASRATALASRPIPKPKSAVAASAFDGKSFREKREKERQEKLARDRAQIALLKKRPDGPMLSAVSLKGKDHTPQIPGMMVSSESEADDDDDELDRELFGIDKPSKVSEGVEQYREAKLRALRQAQQQGPVKKVKQVRNAKDMRARLAPDLSPLHRTILSWDFFHTGEFPPNSEKNDYSLVSNTFKTSNEYQATFQPLLILEAWQGFAKSREETNGKAFEIKIANRLTVDTFVEVSSSMSQANGRELGIGEADIILMSKAEAPMQDPKQPHCLARVSKITRKKNVVEVTYRVNTNNPLLSYLTPNSSVRGVKVNSITPLEREYGALLGLQYYDLCDEIIKAKPSPLLSYSEQQLAPITKTYRLNLAQSKAIRSAMDNDAFTLIQGPPGSGKTKTIVAIVGALLSKSIADQGVSISRPQNPQLVRPPPKALAKKLLVCAPSNAAADELVMRFKEGVKTLNGEVHKISVIRLGRSDAINTNVLDVTLDELVTKKLNSGSGKQINYQDEIHKHVEEYKSLSESQNLMRSKLEEARAKKEPVADLEREFELQKRKRTWLGMKIDELRDKSSTAQRDTEISRRRVQQEVLDGAHILCATLSGSGHEMFQNLSIEFETVIIDEAAQSIELSALIPLKYGCSKCILVGDPKQLPPTVLSREAARFSYEQSLFVRMQANHPNDVHLLDTQYRMHPEISRFPSQAFYDGRLLDGDGMASLRQRSWHDNTYLGPYRFFDVQGQQSSAPKGRSLVNLAEVQVALQLFERLTTDYRPYNFDGKIGIITPYRGQLAELKQVFHRRYGDDVLKNVDFNTTDAFQGRESEIIIFSCVRASSTRGIGFLDDIRRMNVGLTRAKSSLWVLGNSRSLSQNEFWGGLIEDARRRNCYIGGDLLTVLNQPTKKQWSVSRPAAHGQAGRSQQTSTLAAHGGPEIEMTDAPGLNDTSLSRREPGSVSSDVTAKGVNPSRKQVERPSLRSGLNPNASCLNCGSTNHRSNDCDNEAARAGKFDPCLRCGQLDHWYSRCAAELCIICGELGHVKARCMSKTPLPKHEQAALRRNEHRYEAMKQAWVEKARQRQLGDHAAKVPTVQPTRKTPPLDAEGRVDRRRKEDGKRKRPPSPPTGLVPARAPSGPLSMLPITNPGVGGLPSLNEDAKAPSDKSAGHKSLVSRGPRPPRKKKEVDPFIRPNRKKPRV